VGQFFSDGVSKSSVEIKGMATGVASGWGEPIYVYACVCSFVEIKGMATGVASVGVSLYVCMRACVWYARSVHKSSVEIKGMATGVAVSLYVCMGLYVCMRLYVVCNISIEIICRDQAHGYGRSFWLARAYECENGPHA
jgi:hypothetical protein